MKVLKIMLLALFLLSGALIAGCQSEQASNYDAQVIQGADWHPTGTGWYSPRYAE